MNTAALATMRVLIADDERAVAQAAQRRLEREGADCESVHTGREALERLAGAQWDLVLTDLLLPGASGAEVLAAALAREDAPAVLVLAAEGDGAAAADLLNRGADGVVRKPLDAELLAHAAAAALDRRSLERALRAASAARAAGPVLQLLGEIVAAYEKADPFRAGFSSRTARLAVAIGSAVSLDAEKLALAAKVHDVGMLAVPVAEQHVTSKPSRPAQHLIRVHPTLGARWVERLGADRVIVAAVAAHHERWDGGGYPGGLAGADIPPEARVLGTAAAIAAMASARPWREKRQIEDVIQELLQGAGSQFAPEEAAAAAEVLRRIPTILG